MGKEICNHRPEKRTEKKTATHKDSTEPNLSLDSIAANTSLAWIHKQNNNDSIANNPHLPPFPIPFKS